MFWYLLFFISIFTITYSKFSLYKKIVALGSVVFLFSALRYGISYDYFLYIRFILSDYRHKEPIPALIEELAHYIGFPFFFVITSFITTVCFIKGIKKGSTYPIDSIYFYIGCPFLFFNYISIVRQALATGFVLLAMTYGYDKKKIKTVCLLLAVCCHFSAIVAFLLYLPLNKFDRKKMWQLMFVSLFWGTLFISLLMNVLPSGYLSFKLNQYATTNMAGGTIWRVFVYLLTIIVMINHNKLLSIRSINKYYINNIYMGTILYSLLSVNTHMAIRTYSFFGIALLFLIPDIIRIYGIKKLFYRVVCIAMFCVSVWGAYVTNDRETIVFYPYRTYFDINLDDMINDVIEDTK